MYDSHAHLNDAQFAEDVNQVIARAKAKGVRGIINVGFDLSSSCRAVELAHSYPDLWAVVGVHPHDADQLNADVVDQLITLAADDRVVAIGETGLDYYYDNSPRPSQQQAFRRHLELGRALSLPVVIHSRDAAQDTYDIVREYPDVPCVLHCYSGSAEMAEKYLAMGYYLSFGGAITFKNAHRLREVVKAVGLDRVMIETDCPYLAPVPYRGKRNEPAHVEKVVEMLAEIHQVSKEQVISTTCSNTEAFFGLE